MSPLLFYATEAKIGIVSLSSKDPSKEISPSVKTEIII
jgi:hypothetical protein